MRIPKYSVFSPERVRGCSDPARGERQSVNPIIHQSNNPAVRAFTMIEIAISLAVIGFALVAIIGILPTGLDVQKQNREETIINQDAQMWMEAIRNGAQGMDDLTNYVDGISNYVRTFRGPAGSYTYADRVDSYTYVTAPYGITNGYRIVGLLSTPKFTYDDPNLNLNNGDFTSNYVVAYVRSMSGTAFDKYPQDNATLRDASFKYKLISEVTPYYYTDNSWMDSASTSFQGVTYTNIVSNKKINLYDVRLIFRWPVLPNGNIGPNRLVFRTLMSGSVTNELTNFKNPLHAYFFENRNYVKAK
jgi:type II secretory pathway pseudopilin PulG